MFDILFLIFSNPLIPFISQVIKEVDPSGESVTKIIENDVSLFSGIISVIIAIGSAVGGGVAWLKKQNVDQYNVLKSEMTSQFEGLKSETTTHFETLKTETTHDLKVNKEQIQNTKDSLQNQIITSEQIIKEKIEMQKDTLDEFKDTQKDTMNEIKTVVNKINDKMDTTAMNVAKNSVRIDGHDVSIKDIEDEVFKKKRYVSKSPIK
jgi:hypothetical protein